ncbi:MAG: helix-turn-helix domain-containing protein [archaeon]
MTDVKEYLQRLGLNSYQASTLTALFENPESDAKLLSVESGVPYTKIYEALDAMEQRGLVQYTLGKPRVYKSLEPQTIFDTLISQQEKQLKQLRKSEKDILSGIQLQDGTEKEVDKSRVWLFSNPASLYDEVSRFFTVSKKEYWGTGVMSSAKDSFTHPGMNKNVLDFLARGGKFKMMLTADGGNLDKWSFVKSMKPQVLYQLMKILGHKNFEFRIIASNRVQNDLVIGDEKRILLSFKGEDGCVKMGMTFEDPSIAKFMSDHVKALWEEAEPMGKTWFRGLKQK